VPDGRRESVRGRHRRCAIPVGRATFRTTASPDPYVSERTTAPRDRRSSAFEHWFGWVGRMNCRSVGYCRIMTRRPILVAAWLWATVLALLAGRASYAVVRVLGPDVLLGALVLVAVGAVVVQIRRRGLPLRGHALTHKASIGS
jgi:hypothetical protein